MDNKRKVIIGILISTGVILFIAIMVIVTSKKNVAGIYKYNNQKIELNEDKSCKYVFIDKLACKWELSKDKVNIIISGYSLKSDLYHYERNEQTSIAESYDTKEKCLQKVNELKPTYDVLTPNCDYFENTYKAEIKDNGLLINNVFYEKVEEDEV